MHEGGKYYMESRPYDKRFRKVDTTEQLLEGMSSTLPVFTTVPF